MQHACARHILVSNEQLCQELKRQLDAGADFAALARQHSQCATARQGGDLGRFCPGQMGPVFDAIVFREAIGLIHGPVQSQLGFHLIQITERHE